MPEEDGSSSDEEEENDGDDNARKETGVDSQQQADVPQVGVYM